MYDVLQRRYFASATFVLMIRKRYDAKSLGKNAKQPPHEGKRVLLKPEPCSCRDWSTLKLSTFYTVEIRKQSSGRRGMTTWMALQEAARTRTENGRGVARRGARRAGGRRRRVARRAARAPGRGRAAGAAPARRRRPPAQRGTRRGGRRRHQPLV